MGAEFSIAGLIGAIVDRVPDRPAVVHDRGEMSYRELVDRSRRLARYLADRGLGARPQPDADGVRHDLMAQYLYNSPAYLEGMLGAWTGRLAPFNVNYRYVAEELRYLLRDARPAAIQYHACFAPLLEQVLPDLPKRPVLLQVADGSGTPLLPDAVDYEQALASVPADPPAEPSPDDLYLLYTGGTTGMPKGVMWRQADALVSLMGLRNNRTGQEWASLEEKLSTLFHCGHRIMPLAPYMHGASQFSAVQALCDGNTVAIQSEVRRFDPADCWDSAARFRVTSMLIVGDAFARPLADEIEARPRELPALRYLYSGGAALSDVHRRRLEAAVPGLTVVESIGSSETGIQGHATKTPRTEAGRRTFARGGHTLVLSEDRSRVLEPGHEGVGWLATRGRVPLGYLRDPDKSARTFPTVAGQRVSVPGDRARLLADSHIELLGRDSTTINTGGEKVFAEEVEAAVRAHPDVVDAVVCGRPSEQWGTEVAALVQPRTGARIDQHAVLTFCADRIARYKLPKAVIFVDRIERTPAGKADYRWAGRVAAGA
jgi:fatty-acyl-CoA synthase